MKLVYAVIAAAAMLGIGSSAQARTWLGPRSDVSQINADTAKVYHLAFRGGEFGQVRVRSYGPTVVYVVVRDTSGRVVAVANDCRGDAVATWYVPEWETYTIQIVNEALIENSYTMATN